MTEHQHEYFAGVCSCGKKQPIYRDGKEVSQSIKSDVKIAYRAIQKPTKRITSEFQSVVDETMVYLGEDIYKKGNFGKYCGIIGRVGMNQARIWIKYMKSKGITNPAYFWGIYKNFNQSKLKQWKK